MLRYLWIPAVLALVAFLIVIKSRQPARRASVDKMAAKNALLENVKQFSGCFQPLADAVQDGNVPLTERLMDMWKKRSSDLTAVPDYLETLCKSEKDILAAANAWIKTLENWGIQHDTQGNIFEITKEHEKLYLFDDVYAFGDYAKVLRPAWWMRKDELLICIETGTAEIE